VTSPIARRISAGNGDATASPRQRTTPAVGFESPAERLITVVLPAPFRAEQPDNRPGLDRKREAVEGGAGAESLRGLVQLDDGPWRLHG
jgi:hypothetical protein